MVVAVTVGIVLAALLFMRRMAELSSVTLVGRAHELQPPLPPGVILYDIGGPLSARHLAELRGVSAFPGRRARGANLTLRRFESLRSQREQLIARSPSSASGGC